MADGLVEQTAKGSQALKSDFEADICNPQIFRAQQLFGLFNPAFDQILVRSLVECLSEQSQKVIARKAGMA